MEKLALFGGNPVRTTPFPAHNPIGKEERDAAVEVIDSGVLSQFIGAWHKDFYGGAKVRSFEAAWAALVGTEHAVSVNSAASGLLVAIGAAGIAPGDEVIVSPYTMSASATAIVNYGAIPVFADIEPDMFCLDPVSVERLITPRTKALMIVHIFGQAANMDALLALAKKHDLVVIEDAAQAPGARYQGRMIGGLGDMTVFSLNYHKHIHTGEGGVVTTNSAHYAERLQLIRNHGESVVEAKGVTDLVNTMGFNLRLTEISAAIGIEQLKKLPGLLEQRIENANYLSSRLGALPGVTAPVVRKDCSHVYYMQEFLIDEALLGVSRNAFVEAVSAELPTSPDRDWPLIEEGYVRPLYLLPMYQHQIAYGPHGFPFKSPQYKGKVNYEKGICPVVERINQQIVSTEFMRSPATIEDMKDVVRAFEKVFEQRAQLVAGVPA